VADRSCRRAERAWKVFSDIQQALVPHIPGLGTEAYQATVEAAYSAIDQKLR